ncbi:hypothetical protein [Paraburkholderia sp. JHI869]|uniref:hypothetical protein n=1 Tax=Paraburkholderia sp. JHI869 TaxID=3112959 RepID=UPI00317E6276
MKIRLLVCVPRGATLRNGDAHEVAHGAAKEVRDPGMAAIGTKERLRTKTSPPAHRLCGGSRMNAHIAFFWL